MKIYLLALLLILAINSNAQKCQQIGSSPLAKLANCKINTPAPRLQWSINVTLLQEYNWQGPDDVKYAYYTIDDQPIDEQCYQGQNLKGKYPKGATILVEHLCFGFKPSIQKGAKLYLYLFSSQDSGSSQIIYMTFNGEGEWVQK